MLSKSMNRRVDAPLHLLLLYIQFSRARSRHVKVEDTVTRCYGILALETSIFDLAYPFGRSNSSNIVRCLLNLDVSIAEMCEVAAAEIIDWDKSTKWKLTVVSILLLLNDRNRHWVQSLTWPSQQGKFNPNQLIITCFQISSSHGAGTWTSILFLVYDYHIQDK